MRGRLPQAILQPRDGVLHARGGERLLNAVECAVLKRTGQRLVSDARRHRVRVKCQRSDQRVSGSHPPKSSSFARSPTRSYTRLPGGEAANSRGISCGLKALYKSREGIIRGVIRRNVAATTALAPKAQRLKKGHLAVEFARVRHGPCEVANEIVVFLGLKGRNLRTLSENQSSYCDRSDGGPPEGRPAPLRGFPTHRAQKFLSDAVTRVACTSARNPSPDLPRPGCATATLLKLTHH
jgi:hypothetical protein